MRVVCVDKYAPTARYFEVEYFDPVSKTAQNSYLVTDFSPFLLIEQETKQTVGLDYELPASAKDSQGEMKCIYLLYLVPLNFAFSELISVFLDVDTEEWRTIRDLTPLLTYGSPYAFTSTEVGQSDFTGVLINDVSNNWVFSIFFSTRNL